MGNYNDSQGLLVYVYESRIVINSIDFINDNVDYLLYI